jgi:hypothetical protein
MSDANIIKALLIIIIVLLVAIYSALRNQRG